MLHLIFNSIRGRRRETSFLFLVLMISFAFSSVMAILFPSTQLQMQRDREDTYGSWQMLLYDQNGGLSAPVERAAEAAGAETVRVRTVAHTQSDSQIAVMDDAMRSVGNFTLLEGRWPQEEDELLIVAGSFPEGAGLAVGDEIPVDLLWDSLYRENALSQLNERQLHWNVAQEALAERWEEYYPAFQAFWDGGGKANFAMEAEADQLSEWDALNYASAWAIGFTDEFAADGSFSRVPTLLGDGLTLREAVRTLRLEGPGYGELQGTAIKAVDYEELLLRRTYRVCGILPSYEGTWDLGGHDMPAAFLSEAGEADIISLLDGVREAYPELRFEAEAETLLFGGTESAEALYEALLPAYRNALPPRYRVELQLSDTGAGSGILVGKNTETGELEYLHMSVSGNTFYVTLPEGSYPGDFDSLYSGQWRIEGLDPLEPEVPTLEELYDRNTYPFRLNAPAWPREDGTARSYAQNAMAATLTVLSGCAVLTVCMIQKKKRVRSLLTLKAIGMDDRQGAALLAVEWGLFWAFALVPGVILGLGAAWLYLGGQTAEITLAVDWPMLLASLGGVTVAAAAGFALPLLTAMSLPLTGQLADRPGRPPGPGRRTGRSYLSLEREKRRFRPGKDLPIRVLSCLMVFAALLTLSLSHQAFSDYRARVERTGRPDYTLSASYGMSDRYWREQTDQLSQLAEELGMEPLQTYLAAEGVLLSCSSFLADSPILSHYKQHEADTRFASDPTGASCFITDVIGVTADSPLLAHLSQACTEGSVDPQALESGQGCVLLVPMYQDQGEQGLQLTFDPGMAQLYAADTAVAVGDRLSLSAASHMAADTVWVTTWGTTELTVQAIVRYFPEEGLWPFGGDPKGYTVVSGPEAVRALYPKASTRPSGQSMALQEIFQQLHCGNCDGKTYFHLRCGNAGPDDTALWNLAQDSQYHMTNHRNDNDAISQTASFQRAMTLLLGAASQLLLVTILGFLVFDRVEQERRRLGILRALGLSRSQLLGGQALLAAARAAAICLLANGAMGAVWTAAALAGGARSPVQLISYAGQSFLWRYPWAVHGMACAALWAVLTALFLIPYLPTCKQTIIQLTREQEGR